MAVRRRAAAVTIVATLVLALSGCGAGAGPSVANVSVDVTRDFGARGIARVVSTHSTGGETVMALLERHLRVRARYGNDFVESIAGLSGAAAHLDWFYYVNGVEAAAGAGTTAVHAGDRIWWDLHDWVVTDSIPAVVGSYPAPFTDGGGSRATPVSCAADVPAACTTVAHALARAGVRVSRRPLAAVTGSGGRSPGAGRPAIVVGTESELAGVPAARLIAAGPKASGVYARFGDHGRSLQLLDPHGARVATLGGGAGLVAATALDGGGPPTWLVTGTDQTGVQAAARALTAGRLSHDFALALSGGRSFPLPRDPSS